MLTSSTAVLAAAVAVLGLGTPARAEGSQPSTKVYLDAATGEFNAPLRRGANREIEVFTLVEPGATVELKYWYVDRKETCPKRGSSPGGLEALDDKTSKKKKDRETIRSAVPSTVEGDRQRYVMQVGPLKVGMKYCFFLDAKVPKALAPEQRSQLTDALRRTLSAAQAWDLTGPGSASPDEQDPTLRRHAAACKAEIDPSRPRLITGCELAREFGEQIAGTGLETLKVLGDSGEDLSLVEAFEAIVDEQDIFRELLTDALIATRALTNATGISEDPVRELDALIGGPDYVYDPLEGLDAATLLSAARARRVPKASQKALDALVGQGRADLVRGVWAQRQALVERQVWLHFPASAGDSSDRRRARLKSFLQADAAPKLVKITAGDRARAASRVGGTPGKEVADAAAKLLRAQPDITELRAMPGWSSSGGAQSIESYLTLLARIELRHRQVTEARAELDALLSAGPDGTRHPAYARFLERVRSIKKIQSPTGDFTDDPDFASRFPLYATAELGVALALLPVRGQGPRVEPMTYFGVNLYFAPLDKDEPLTRIIDRKDWSGRTFLRRFSLMAGVSILRGDLNQELGVNGVLNRQFLLGGFGVRWTDYLRFGLGATLYRQDSPNPLSDRRTLRAAPYLSAGIDIDIIGQINKWYRLRNQ